MPKISLEREIRKVLISTPIIEKEYYDPQKEKQLERKKSNKKNYGTIYFKKLTKKKSRNSNKQICKKCLSYEFEELDNLLI